jgi:hypothetical protein
MRSIWQQAYGIPQSLGELLDGEDTGEVFRDSAMLSMPVFQMANTYKKDGLNSDSSFLGALSCSLPCIRSIFSKNIHEQDMAHAQKMKPISKDVIFVEII